MENMSTTDLILRPPNAQNVKKTATKRAAQRAAMRAATRAKKRARPFPARRRRMAGKPKASLNVAFLKTAKAMDNTKTLKAAAGKTAKTGNKGKPASPPKKVLPKKVLPNKKFLPKAEYERILRTYQPGAPPLTPKAYEFLDGVIVRDVLGPLSRSIYKPQKFGNSIHTTRRMFQIAHAGVKTSGFPFYFARPKDRVVYAAVGKWFSGPMSADLLKFFKVPAATWAPDSYFKMKCAAVVTEFIDDIFTAMVKKGWDHYYAKKNIAPSIGIGSKIKRYADYKASWFGKHPELPYHITRRDIHRGLSDVDGDDANFQAVFKSVFGARTNANLDVKARKFIRELVKKMGPEPKPFIRS